MKGSNEWATLMDLAELETYTAPWWLLDKDTPVDKLNSELAEAKSKVEAALSALQSDE